MAKDLSAALIISLDFELFWGVRDHLTLDEYKENLLGVRRAVPALLELFRQYEIHATWATVGFLFCKTRQALLESAPAELPKYREATLAPYGSLNEIGESEEADPFHYGASLIQLIKATPFQEIGTHTLSHYFCLEPEQNVTAFKADLARALELGRRNGCEINSLVFPRNQYDAAHIAAAAELGITSYRGTEQSWIYAGRSRNDETKIRRLARLLDAYVGVTGANSFPLTEQNSKEICNLPSSRFLRPYSPKLAVLDGLRLRRIARAMEHAAKNQQCFHLWWHPHNFGKYLADNLRFLERVLRHFDELRERYGMMSLSMSEAANRAMKREQVVAAR